MKVDISLTKSIFIMRLLKKNWENAIGKYKGFEFLPNLTPF